MKKCGKIAYYQTIFIVKFGEYILATKGLEIGEKNYSRQITRILLRSTVFHSYICGIAV